MTFNPFDDRDGVVWLDGGFVPWRSARLHVLSHALHYFLTGTAAEVTPVREIGPYRFCPGRLCELVMEAYEHECTVATH